MSTTITQQPKLKNSTPPAITKEDPAKKASAPSEPEIKPPTTSGGFSRYPLEKFLGKVDKVVVSQNVEKIETATSWMSLGCCKVETENRYELVDVDSRKTLFVADEESLWCLRNPCCCCD